MPTTTQTDRLSDDQVERFHRDGFLNAGMVLSDEEVGELSEALAAVIDCGPGGFSKSEPHPVLFRDMGAGYDADGKTVSKNPNYQMEFLGKAMDLKTRDEFSNLPDFTPPADSPFQSVTTRPCPVQRGEVHFHHSLTWHGSPFNQSDRPRQALAIHYMTSEAVFTGRDHVMRQFISLDVGQPMLNAGPHFPVVCRNGEPVGA